MKDSTRHNKNKKPATRKSQQLLPALVAVGGACALASAPTSALELGELRIDSALGQPLRASIAYALNPNEQLFDFCIYLRPGVAGSGIPAVSRAIVSITKNTIVLTGDTPIREPLLSMQVAVDCPYTPRLLRDYTLLVDPGVPIAASAPATGNRPVGGSVPASVPPAPIQRRPAPTALRTLGDKSPIRMPGTYRVQPGDSVSTIVSRIQGRTVALWPAVMSIFEANPNAFVNNDVNRLMAGSVLQIPDLAGVVIAERAVATHSTADNAEPAATDAGVAYSGDDTGERSEENQQIAVEELPAAAAPAIADPVVSESPLLAAMDETAMPDPGPAEAEISELRPGDVVMTPIGSDSREIGVRDAAVSSEPAAVAVPVDANRGTELLASDGWSWLKWLGGAGMALILGLLFFGRALRERFGSVAVGAVAAAPRRHDDDPTQENFVIAEVDLDFEDTINAQAISLDADLGAGTGLQDGGQMDVAQDFGYTATGATETRLDMEITEEAAREIEVSSTDVIPPANRAAESSILEKEILPGEDVETGDYAMSMILDATKQPLGDDDGTAKDLHAVIVATDDDYLVSDDTLTDAVDLHILEQDYEDDMTATQALNVEIENAARELARRMADEETGEITAANPMLDLTAEIPNADFATEMATVETPHSDVTAEMPTMRDADNTAELTANISTEIEAENDAQADIGSATTIEMAAAGSDVTVEMDVETGRFDTKKKT